VAGGGHKARNGKQHKMKDRLGHIGQLKEVNKVVAWALGNNLSVTVMVYRILIERVIFEHIQTKSGGDRVSSQRASYPLVRVVGLWPISSLLAALYQLASYFHHGCLSG
jgi:hypothetical protein